MIKYLGSKRTLLNSITAIVQSFPEVRSAIDLFSGTSRVGHALKAAGYQVFANDNNRYAHLLATCYVEADLEEVQVDAQRLIAEFNSLKGEPGYFTETFCKRSRYIQPHNGERIDAIRNAIQAKCLPRELEAVVLVSLIEAADRVDSTTGVQMAYLKQWSERSKGDLELRMPRVLPRARHGKGRAFGQDVFQVLGQIEADLAYIDPPYNSHSYLGNYHVWETLARWDRPDVYGVACKRSDCRSRTSVFNSKMGCLGALERVIRDVKAPILVLSFNNEGFIDRTQMESLLAQRGELLVIENDFKRYIGAQIGIFNQRGERVGEVSHLRNKEYLYVVAPKLSDAIRARFSHAPAKNMDIAALSASA